MFSPGSFIARLAKGCSTIVENSGPLRINPNWLNARCIHLTSATSKEIRTRQDKIRVGQLKTGNKLEGERMADIYMKEQTEFPDANTPDTLYHGIPYKQLPIINIKATPNNTIITYTTADGKVVFLTSAGCEGFKKAKKGTNVAAQAAALSMGTKIVNTGNPTARLRLQGLGNGRAASLKGLLQAGLEIVSVTDNTHISWDPPRPRKVRRI